MEAVGAPLEGYYIEQIEYYTILFDWLLAVRLKLILKKEVDYLRCFSYKIINHLVLSDHSKVFGYCY